MKESFLHYLWQFQLFHKTGLKSTAEENILVEKTGMYTEAAGPDFVNAKVWIGNQLWVGTIEIHLKSSDWYVHNHERDPAYENVILHVVWEDDMPVFRKNETVVSTLELKGLVPQYLLQNYNELFQKNKNWIACEKNIHKIDHITWIHWIERLYTERLQAKTAAIEHLLSKSANNWEWVLFVLMARNFGLKLNADSFYNMALNLDYQIVKKESNNTKNLEALFLGMSGLLSEKTNDTYEKELYQIFAFLKHKYQLTDSCPKPIFFKQRPPNFPTIRLSQLAFLLEKRKSLFQSLMLAQKKTDFYDILECQTSEYWETHFVFGKENKKLLKKTTKPFIDLLLINTIIPLKFSYQQYLGKPENESIFKLSKDMEAEKNTILTNFQRLKVPARTAMDSQALLTLKNDYCNVQNCLHCEIGVKILNLKEN